MRYLSVCSGIEAATAAWHPLGWTPVAFAEIDKFPRAVLAHHYPHVPNWGDVNNFAEWPDVAIDVLVGGTPCQSFSVAGLREGLDDPRGNLMLVYLAIARRYRPRWLVWENVPGVLSSDDGRAFGTLLRGMADVGYGYSYRVLDAQHFGLAQRRARVFVVAHLGDWRRAAAVLFEPESLSWHPAPSREERQGVAPTLAARTRGGGGLGTDFDCDGGLIPDVVPPLFAGANRSGGNRPLGTNADGAASLIPVLANPLTARMGKGVNTTCDEGQTMIAEPITLAIRGRGDGRDLETRADGLANALITPSGGRDGLGVGAVATIPIMDGAKGRRELRRARDGHGVGIEGDPMYTLRQGSAHAVATFVPDMADPISTHEQSTWTHEGNTFRTHNVMAFSMKDHGADASEDIAPTLRAGAHDGSHANGGAMPAVALHEGAHGLTETAHASPLTGGGGKPGQSYPAVRTGMHVRRLTPRECERLQGFPDDYTLIPYRRKLAADGPRYKALGNSMAVPVMRWIGRRMQMVDEIP